MVSKISYLFLTLKTCQNNQLTLINPYHENKTYYVPLMLIFCLFSYGLSAAIYYLL